MYDRGEKIMKSYDYPASGLRLPWSFAVRAGTIFVRRPIRTYRVFGACFLSKGIGTALPMSRNSTVRRHKTFAAPSTQLCAARSYLLPLEMLAWTTSCTIES